MLSSLLQAPPEPDDDHRSPSRMPRQSSLARSAVNGRLIDVNPKVEAGGSVDECVGDEIMEEPDSGPNNGNGDEDADEDDEVAPLLPIFSAAHLDSLPVYELTHSIRLLVQGRCETSLSWDQLRSPQVSQFLIKPIQQRIRTSFFSRATLYALMANCLQFDKEAYAYPGNSGTSRTRALVCELLAIKLLKEFTTRELVGRLTIRSAESSVNIFLDWYGRLNVVIINS